MKRVLFFAGTLMITGLLLSTSTGKSAEVEFVGSKKCKICHKASFAIWEESKHAQAFANLPDDKKTDSGCLKCHSTGHEQPANEKAVLDNVGCEVCHGAGSGYKSTKVMSKKLYKSQPDVQHQMSLDAGLIIPNEQTCQTCHDGSCEFSKEFNYAERWELIKHEKGS